MKGWSCLSAAALLLGLSACAPGLEERLESARAYQAGKAEETEAFFKDRTAPLTLPECREWAQTRTLKLTQARLDASLARIQSTAAFSAFLPQVEWSYQRSGTDKTLRTRVPSLGLSVQMQDKWMTQSALTISQPVFAPNAWLLWLAARRGADLQKLTVARNEEMLDVQVATLFYQAAVAARTIEAYDAQAEASAELVRQIEALEAEGLALRGEAARARAFHENDLYNAQVARDNAFAAKANLLDLMNLHPLSDAAPPLDGESLLAVQTLPWGTMDAEGQWALRSREDALALPLEEWLWTALVARKEMWAGDLTITLRKVEALAALAHFLPTLSVTGGRAADYQAAREQEKAAYALREDAAATLMVSVWQAWTNWRQARDLKAVAAIALQAAEVDYAETKSRYENDQETLSEVLDKFSALEQARIDAVASEYADALAEYVFRDTVGLGWGGALTRPGEQRTENGEQNAPDGATDKTPDGKSESQEPLLKKIGGVA